MKSNSIFTLIAVFFTIGLTPLRGQTDPPTLPEPPLSPEYWDFTKANEDKILKTLPQEAKTDLLKVKDIDEEEYYDILSDAPHYYFDFEHDFVFDPFEKKRIEQSQKVDQWEMHTEALGFLYENAAQSEKAGIKTKLQSKLEQLFDLKEEERRLEVEFLEKELQELKASLEVRKKNKAQIINRRLQELIGLEDYLDWD